MDPESGQQTCARLESNTSDTLQVPSLALQPPDITTTQTDSSATNTKPAILPSHILSSSHLSVNNLQSYHPRHPDNASLHGHTGSASIRSHRSSRPPSLQHVGATVSALMRNTEARRIRVNLYRDLVEGWLHLSTGSRIFLLYYIAATLIEIVATIVVLVIEREKVGKCFYLTIFLGLYLLRAIVICGILLRRFLYERPDDLPQDLSGVCGAHYKTMINWVSLVLVMLSISLLTTQSHCAEDSPGLFYLVLVLSLLGYLCMAVLLLLWLVVLFCLSGLVFVLEWFGVGPTVMQWQGATQEMLDGIPVIKFSKPVADSSETNTGSTQQQPSSTHQLKPLSPISFSSVEKGVGGNTVAIDMEPTTNTMSDRNIPKSFPDTADVDTNAAVGVNTTIPQYAEGNVQSGPVEALELDNLTPGEQAQESSSLPMCSICLCEYEDLDTLRLLPCSHDFHKDCVDEWLRLKRTCPLCKQDISQFKPGNKFWSRRQRHNGGSGGDSHGERRFWQRTRR